MTNLNRNLKVLLNRCLISGSFCNLDFLISIRGASRDKEKNYTNLVPLSRLGIYLDWGTSPWTSFCATFGCLGYSMVYWPNWGFLWSFALQGHVKAFLHTLESSVSNIATLFITQGVVFCGLWEVIQLRGGKWYLLSPSQIRCNSYKILQWKRLFCNYPYSFIVKNFCKWDYWFTFVDRCVKRMVIWIWLYGILISYTRLYVMLSKANYV